MTKNNLIIVIAILVLIVVLILVRTKKPINQNPQQTSGTTETVKPLNQNEISNNPKDIEKQLDSMNIDAGVSQDMNSVDQEMNNL